MHFWIDKHSQTQARSHCAVLSGRRRFTSLSASGGGGRRWRGAKPMVTPVHRFQPIECVAANATHAHAHNHHPQTTIHNSSQRRNTTGDLPARAHAVELDSSVFLDLPLDGSSESPSPHPPIQPSQVKSGICGLRLSFALLTAIIGGARLYSEYQGTGTEVLYTLFLVAVVTLCAATLYRSMLKRSLAAEPAVTGLTTYGVRIASTDDSMSPSLPHHHHPSTNHQPPPSHLTPPPPTIEPPPPPYHIAVLLPTQHIRCMEMEQDAPPPSYDKAVVS